MKPFQPMFILPTELASWGLPDAASQPDILRVVSLASTIVDQACGRIDGDGNGSLAYTTYRQQLLLQTRNRNLVQIPLKPIAGVATETVAELSALATAASGADDINCYYTGCVANSYNGPDGTLSGVVAASGRYGYTRQDMSVAYPDLFAFINPLNLVTMFGGPAPWIPIDITNLQYDPRTGEAWIPAGLQLQRYSEVLFTYNSGFDPRQMPWAIKHVCASLVKNALAKGDGTTALMSMSIGKAGVNMGLYQELIDPTLDRLLTPFKAVRAY